MLQMPNEWHMLFAVIFCVLRTFLMHRSLKLFHFHSNLRMRLKYTRPTYCCHFAYSICWALCTIFTYQDFVPRRKREMLRSYNKFKNIPNGKFFTPHINNLIVARFVVALYEKEPAIRWIGNWLHQTFNSKIGSPKISENWIVSFMEILIQNMMHFFRFQMTRSWTIFTFRGNWFQWNFDQSTIGKLSNYWYSRDTYEKCMGPDVSPSLQLSQFQ